MGDFTANVDGDLEKKGLHQRDCQRDVSPNATSGRCKLSMHLLVSQQSASEPGAETLHRSCCHKDPFVLEGATHGEESQQDLAGWEVRCRYLMRRRPL